MEPFTTAIAAEVAETAKEIYDAAKDIKRTYDVSKQMKNVAESEGKEQLSAISRVSTSVAKDIETGDLNSNEKSTLTKDVQVFSEPPVESNFPSKMSGNVFFDEMPQLEGKGETLPTLSGDVFYEKEPGQLELNDPFETRTISEDRMHEQPQNVETIVLEQSNELGLNVSEEVEANTEQNGLTDDEKGRIKEQTAWSDKIIDAIRTYDEAQVYMEAGLKEAEINGKPALIQPRIDGSAHNDSRWPEWSNKDLAGEGYPPRDENGAPYELHHIGQKPNSPLAELTHEQHHCDGNFKVLHTFEESSIDRMNFSKEREEYWMERNKTL